jgi:3'-phosphoadenosine 5'-phosphosulfate synthase
LPRPRSTHTTHHTDFPLPGSVAAPPKKALPLRIASFLAIAVAFTTVGFMMTGMPVIQMVKEIDAAPSDEESLTMYTPEDANAQEIEDFINNHHVVRDLRSKPEFTESRPHLKMPKSMRSQSLTGGTLIGPNRVVVPPFAWNEEGGKSLVSVSYLGRDLCGHPGIIHGGFLATMLDEGLARCCFAALPNKVAMTANLNINYRSPAPADTFVVLRAQTIKVEGRKAWVEGRIETLVGEGETPVVLADATALFIEPRQAASMARIYPVK